VANTARGVKCHPPIRFRMLLHGYCFAPSNQNQKMKNIKSTIISGTVLILSIASLSGVHAQACAESKSMSLGFHKGIKTISGGYGFGSISLMSMTFDFNSVKSEFGPLYGKIEYGFSRHSSIALNAAYEEFRVAQKYSGITYNELSRRSGSVLIRWNYHFIPERRTDIYFGTGLGARFAESSFEEFNTDSNTYYSSYHHNTFTNPFGWETTLGLRIYLNQNIAFYGEAGFAKSLAQAGMTVNF
jgi:hypothetical protein